MKNFSLTRSLGTLLLMLLISCTSIAQEKYTTVYETAKTSVKDQQRTGTCWCFSTISFLESEVLKSQKKSYDFSEMFVVKTAYRQKIENYLLRQGKANFSEGGQAHDVIFAIKESGLTPQETFFGNTYGKIHNHKKMVGELKEELKKTNDKNIYDDQWGNRFNQILDQYFGEAPKEFTFEGKEYTPKSFFASLGLDLDNYIELTSYSHHPFNTTFVLEIPDNWSNGSYYNVPINRFINIIDHALEKGYSIVWDGDVSEDGFQHKNGVAFLPENTDVSQEARQKTFFNKRTTDDHLMHLVGKATKDGKAYYIIKNSWNTDSNEYGGYLYMSEDFVRLKTVAIMLNKKALTRTEKKLLKI